MGIFLGSNEISNVYVGGNPAEAVYLGSELVWPTEPPWWPDEWEYITATSGVEAMNQSRAVAGSRGINYQTAKSLSFGFDLAGSTTGAGLLYQWGGLERVAIRNTSNITNISSMFDECHSLVEVGPMDCSGVSEDASWAFNNCSSLESIELTSCSNISGTYAMFGDYWEGEHTESLERLLLHGMTTGFEIRNTKMSATALNDLFHSLGNANGSQTINIANTPGAASCDKTIATAKGWTIIG